MAEDVRPISRTSPNTCEKIKYSNRSDTSGSCRPADHRWSATQARLLAPHSHTRIGQVRDRVAARRGRSIGVVAAARELTELIFYGLRDHHVRAFAARTPAPA